MTAPARPEVVQAIMDAVLDMDPEHLAGIPLPTIEEHVRADGGILQALIARSTRGLGDPRHQKSAGGGLDWEGTFAELSEEQRDRAVELNDTIPEQLLPLDDHRAGKQS